MLDTLAKEQKVAKNKTNGQKMELAAKIKQLVSEIDHVKAELEATRS